MTTDGRSTADRVRGVLDRLEIPTAHVILHTMELEWPRLVSALSERIAGLGMFTGDNASPDSLAPFAPRTIAIMGQHRTPAAEEIYQRLTTLPVRKILGLSDYSLFGWSDVAVERTDELAEGLSTFFEGLPDSQRPPKIEPAPVSGEQDGVSYQVGGSGPPLVLFPLGLARSQWEPVLSRLQRRFCTIQLGGQHVGMVASLEFRARGGYLRAVRALLNELDIQPGQQVLEVGCGSGALVRWLAAHHDAVSITAADVNRYLLGEAEALAKRDGLDGRIAFREGNATALPFPDATFDRVYSSTVMEEVDAEKMMAELVRVTRPGGRVAVLTRSVDRPRWVNAPMSPELRAKAVFYSGTVSPGGCADASLYERLPRAGLSDVRMLPQLAIDERTAPGTVEQQVASALTDQEQKELHQALEQAVKAGTFFVAATFHAAVGTKP